jgi:hypothetical protein
MGLLVSFDLDFVMTSELEWGCYATLPALGICQLATRPESPAVYVTCESASQVVFGQAVTRRV